MGVVRSSYGFSLVELVTVLALISIAASLATLSIVRSRNRIRVDRSTSDLRAQIERARALSRMAGSRLGTARVVYDPLCPAGFGGNLLWIDIQPGRNSVILPSSLRYENATDILRVSCQQWDFGGMRGALREASFVSPSVRLTFAFSANGRLAFPDGVAPQDAFIQLQHDRSNLASQGFRILPAGVTCIASNPNAAIEPCDEDDSP